MEERDMSRFNGRTSRAHVMRLVPLGVALVTMGPVAAADWDPTSSTGYPDNPVSDYVDPPRDGLTSYEAPATLDESISSVEVATPSAAPVKAPKPAEWMLVPIPNYNPALGFMVTLMG